MADAGRALGTAAELVIGWLDYRSGVPAAGPVTFMTVGLGRFGVAVDTPRD